MAGKAGCSGGARAGAGRKPKPRPEPAVNPGIDMLEFLQGVAQGMIEATPIQVRAAVAAVQYTHTKRSDGGKRDAAIDAAKDVANGKFKPATPPTLKRVA